MRGGPARHSSIIIIIIIITIIIISLNSRDSRARPVGSGARV
jgi:hypothetical protein